MCKLRSDVSGKECWHLEMKDRCESIVEGTCGREDGNKNVTVHYSGMVLRFG